MQRPSLSSSARSSLQIRQQFTQDLLQEYYNSINIKMSFSGFLIFKVIVATAILQMNCQNWLQDWTAMMLVQDLLQLIYRVYLIIVLINVDRIASNSNSSNLETVLLEQFQELNQQRQNYQRNRSELRSVLEQQISQKGNAMIRLITFTNDCFFFYLIIIGIQMYLNFNMESYQLVQIQFYYLKVNLMIGILFISIPIAIILLIFISLPIAILMYLCAQNNQVPIKQ